MNPSYERQWKEALAGAAIEPSEGVWHHIAGTLDRERGRHNWVIMLLVAASISLAFAFPLTLGDASFRARPDAGRLAVRSQQVPAVDQAPDQVPAAGKQLPVAGVPAGSRSAAEQVNTFARPVYAGQEVPRELPVPELQKMTPGNSGPLATAQLPSAAGYYLVPWYTGPAGSSRTDMQVAFNLGGGGNMRKHDGSLASELAEVQAFAEGDMLTVGSDLRQERPGTTFYAGLGVELPLGRKWRVTTGLGYLSRQATGSSNIVVRENGRERPVTAYDNIPEGAIYLSEAFDYRVSSAYINLPVVFRYPFIDKKVRFRGGLGLSTDIMLDHAVTTKEDGRFSYKGSTAGYKPVSLAGLFNLDVTYDVTDNYTMAFETGWRQHITNLMHNKDYYPSSFTLGLMLYYKVR